MNTRIIFHGFLFLLLTFACKETKEGKGIEGLLYLDGNSVSIEVVDGIIVNVRQVSVDAGASKFYIAPGLIDLQINGYMGISFGDQELSIEQMREITEALWKEGVTSYLPTITTRDHARLLKSFTLLSKALDDDKIGMSIPGFHLEGPYISPVKGFRGAHSEKYIREPDWQEFEELQKAANNGIRLITIAPEVKGGISFVDNLVKSGVVVSLGHHNGTPENINRAVDLGATLSTHLGNGCANMIDRHHNPLWPQLSNDGLSISIIVDGAHLTKEEVRAFYKAKGKDRTILVSDAVSLAGLPLGEYIDDDGDTVLLTKEVVKFPKEDVLYGAAQPISRCVGNIMRFTKCNLGEAIQMASTNPAKLMGLKDVGEIKVGKRADLILFTIEEGELVIQKTIVAGKEVYSKD